MSNPGPTRRDALASMSAIGIGAAIGGQVMASRAAELAVTPKLIGTAEWVPGVVYTDDQRELMKNGIQEMLGFFDELRAVELDNSVAPALDIDPGRILAGRADTPTDTERPVVRATADAEHSGALPDPTRSDDLAFSSIVELSELIRRRRVSSVELTTLYLERLRRANPTLECVISFTEERALEQARRADEEIAADRLRGRLHGIPWGAKDLIAVPGTPTTWGAAPFREQHRDETATVAGRLAGAGAVLVAKLSVGALAWGDVWFGGTTKNPWNIEQGSSGSSAGSASATAAGLVGFAIGTETWGSIVSPCTRCGATGLRPTFGRVSRHGVMALSWSMDKIGPITRSVEDAALVLDAIHGADGHDLSAVDRPFSWPLERDPRTLRVGYVPALFEEDRTASVDREAEGADAEVARLEEWAAHDRRTLEELRRIGFELVPIDLTTRFPTDALQIILTAEASAAFDDLLRSGAVHELVRQEEHAWPNVFRQGQLIPAVEYIRANRIRTLAMREFEERVSKVDAFVAPSFGGNHLLLTNLTGHPALVVPNGFRTSDGTPTSITFTGRLFGETELLAVGHAYQKATSYHLEHPTL